MAWGPLSSNGSDRVVAPDKVTLLSLIIFKQKREENNFCPLSINWTELNLNLKI